MLKALSRIADAFASPFDAAERTKCRYEKWQRRAQRGELKFHRKNTWRQSSKFAEQTEQLFKHFGFQSDEYAGKTIIDLGAGSKLRTRFFQDARLIAIEPLADKFREEIQWCDLDDAAAVYSLPAEEFVADCEGCADLVISINVLDHCYDFAKIIENISHYVASSGLIFLSFDKHEQADEMHPLELDEEICAKTFASSGLTIEDCTSGFGSALNGVQTYGHGPYALNYWLRRQAAA